MLVIACMGHRDPGAWTPPSASMLFYIFSALPFAVDPHLMSADPDPFFKRLDPRPRLVRIGTLVPLRRGRLRAKEDCALPQPHVVISSGGVGLGIVTSGAFDKRHSELSRMTISWWNLSVHHACCAFRLDAPMGLEATTS